MTAFLTRAPSAPRHALERRHALRHVVEGLLVDRPDHHLRRAEELRVVERSDLYPPRRREAGRARRDVGPALGAELARRGRFEVGAAERLRLALRVLEVRD